MKQRYDRHWGRFSGASLALLVLATGCILAGLSFAWQKAVVVPEKHIGLVVSPGMFYGYKYQTIPPGEHSIKNLRKNAQVLAVPIGEREVPFQVRVVPGLLGQAADNLSSSGMFARVKGALVKPIHVTGTLTLDISEGAALTLAKKSKTPMAPDFEAMLTPIIREAVVAGRDQHENVARYSEVSTEAIQESLGALGIRGGRMTISDAIETTVGAESDLPLFTTKVLSGAELATAETRNVFFMGSFVAGLVIAAAVLVFLGLFLFSPGLPIFETLHLAEPIGGIGIVGEVLGAVGDIAGGLGDLG